MKRRSFMNKNKNKTILLSIAFLFLIGMICLLFIASEDEAPRDGQVRIHSSASAMKGKSYTDVIKDFEESGFTNIKTEKVEDLIFGWLTKDGEVESVSIGGEVDYSSGEWVPFDTEVIIMYHTFPEEVDENANDGSNNLPDDAEEDTVLTVENCEALAKIFSNEYDSITCIEFAEKYRGKTIEFDGCIDYVVNSIVYNPLNGSSKEASDQHDILLSYGDYDADTQIGPTLRLKKVSNYALGLKLYDEWPNYLNEGSNVHIKVTVLSFDENTGIFDVSYESIEPR